MRAALAVVLALAGACDGPVITFEPSSGALATCEPLQHSPPCSVMVYAPGALPFSWTCTTGKDEGRPQQLPCVECWPEQSEMCVTPDSVACVRNCQDCVPAQLLELDPHARCTAGDDWPRPWQPRDLALP